MNEDTSRRRGGATSDDLPVIVAGAGPAGLTAATTLARYGIECLLVDRRLRPSPLPRATALSLRTMELLRGWGLEGEVRSGGVDVEWRLLVCETLAAAADGLAIDIGYPTKEQSLTVSPTWPACVPQHHLEQVLLDHLATRPEVRVELGVAVEDVRYHPDGCRVVLRDAATGESRSVAARYVIGADGGRSIVRDRAGIGVRTFDGHHTSVSAIVHAPLWNLVGERRYGLYVIEHPTAGGAFLPAGPDDRWIYAYDAHGDATGTDAEARADDRLAARIRTAVGRPDLPVRVDHVSTFSFTGALADRFRHHRSFLIGDAAHRVTPRGGTGLNSAVADGFDLGWKLAWAMQGWADDALLDSYETERRPVVEHNLERSLDPTGSRRQLDEMHVDIGGRIRHVWLGQSGPREMSTLDLVGPGLTLFTDPSGTHRAARLPAPYPDAAFTTRRVEARVARGLGVTPGGGLLVRPDGVPVSAWSRPGPRPHRTTAAASPDTPILEPQA
jgi:2-polyprenyl-6-methoxyphenol hydroxylase-like FAD-dependent oxidoreductase